MQRKKYRPVLIVAAAFSLLPVCAIGAAGNAKESASKENKECIFRDGDDAKKIIVNCTAAIASASDNHAKAEAYFWRAYSYVEDGDVDKALADLNAAATFEVSLRLLSERAYVLNELGDFAGAIRDLEKGMTMEPDSAKLYRERAWSRHWLADFKGEIEDRLKDLHFEADAAKNLAVAESYGWAGDFDRGLLYLTNGEHLAVASGDMEQQKKAADVRKRLDLLQYRSANKDAAKSCAALETIEFAPGNAPKGIIGDCTRAFLDAKSAKKQADMLTYRSMAWRMLGDEEDAIEDMRIVTALVPRRAMARFNLASALLSAGRPRPALVQADAAVRLDPSWNAFAIRAAIKFDLDDLKGAFDDARKAVDLKPNEIALGVLGDVAYAQNDKEKAKELWLAVYKLGNRADHLMRRLELVGVSKGELEKLK